MSSHRAQVGGYTTARNSPGSGPSKLGTPASRSRRSAAPGSFLRNRRIGAGSRRTSAVSRCTSATHRGCALGRANVFVLHRPILRVGSQASCDRTSRSLITSMITLLDHRSPTMHDPGQGVNVPVTCRVGFVEPSNRIVWSAAPAELWSLMYQRSLDGRNSATVSVPSPFQSPAYGISPLAP